MIGNVAGFLREHWMPAVAAVAAALSMAVVPPDAAYLGYFDLKTLGCLFCVLAVAAAFRLMGAFDRAARAVIARFRRPRPLALALVLVTAVLSAAFTNDVALVIMLPLAAAALVGAGCGHLAASVFACQALAANLCGMITPFGNPQNLYLYSYYHLGLGEFLGAMALPFAASAIGIIAVTWILAGRDAPADAALRAPRSREAEKAAAGRRKPGATNPREPGTAAGRVDGGAPMPLSRRRLAAYSALSLLALLAVFRILPVAFVVAAVGAVLAVADRRALAAVDWGLLLTFACFFVFAGNMARIPELGQGLGALMDSQGLATAAATSQVISNVPAAVLLSHFTEAWRPLLIGVNIGGAGTFVGSLASLIAIRHFVAARKIFPALRSPHAPTTRHFLLRFGALNFAFLAALLLLCS